MGSSIPFLLMAAAVCGAARSHAQTVVPAATPDVAAPACAAPEFRQFDFWVGEWTVVVRDTQVAGVNRITPILGGCALHEEWRGAQGGRGESFNIFDRATGKWHQTWISNNGVMLLLEGGMVDGRMVLAGKRPMPQKPGGIRLDRISWAPLERGDVRQLWEVSDNEGVTWRTVFDGRYAKRPASQAQ
jgi:hypothetical protein